MRYLLDAHAAIWWWIDSDRLSQAARDIVASADTPILVSAASVWEIAIKQAKGRLPEIEHFAEDYPALMASNGFARLDIRPDHALRAAALPGAHRDPFDRMIAAQALIENLVVVTRDPEIARFGCEVLW